MCLLVVAVSTACSATHRTATPSVSTTSLAVKNDWVDREPAAAPLAAGNLVGWLRDGRLVTVATRNGAQHELARMRVNVGSGPAGVALSVDRRTAYVAWTTGEPGCFYELGAIRTDGRGQLRTLDTGTAPAVSPDGTKLAYYRISDSECKEQALVIVDLRSGAIRVITIGHNIGGIDYGGGPWWRADSRHLIAPIEYPGVVERHHRGRELDTSVATTINDASGVDLTCGAPIDLAHFPMGVASNDRVLLVDMSSPTKPGNVSSCDTHNGKVHQLVDLAMRPSLLGWSTSDSGLLAIDMPGDVWHWHVHDTRASRIATGPFQSVSG